MVMDVEVARRVVAGALARLHRPRSNLPDEADFRYAAQLSDWEVRFRAHRLLMSDLEAEAQQANRAGDGAQAWRLGQEADKHRGALTALLNQLDTVERAIKRATLGSDLKDL